jgi:hypothetical protein
MIAVAPYFGYFFRAIFVIKILVSRFFHSQLCEFRPRKFASFTSRPAEPCFARQQVPQTVAVADSAKAKRQQSAKIDKPLRHKIIMLIFNFLFLETFNNFS